MTPSPVLSLQINKYESKTKDRQTKSRLKGRIRKTYAFAKARENKKMRRGKVPLFSGALRNRYF